MQLEGTGASIQHVSPPDQVESSYQTRSDSLRIESYNSSIHPEMCPQVR